MLKKVVSWHISREKLTEKVRFNFSSSTHGFEGISAAPSRAVLRHRSVIFLIHSLSQSLTGRSREPRFKTV
jgi:hypothetical protein